MRSPVRTGCHPARRQGQWRWSGRWLELQGLVALLLTDDAATITASSTLRPASAAGKCDCRVWSHGAAQRTAIEGDRVRQCGHQVDVAPDVVGVLAMQVQH